MPFRVKVVVAALPIAVAPVTPAAPPPILAKAIVPAPAVLLISKAERLVVPPIAPATETAPAPEVTARL